MNLLLLDVSGFCYLPPLGLLYIASYVRSQGYEVRVHVLEGKPGSYSRKYLRDLLDRVRPEVIGIPVFEESVGTVARYCGWIRECSPARIVVGGPQATADPLGLIVQTGADALIVGDGEEKTVEVMRAWESGRPLSTLGRVVTLEGGKPVHGLLCEPTPPLDERPFPDYGLLLSDRDSGVRTMVTGRGCPFRCTFCFEGRTHCYRMRDLDSVLTELRQVLETGQTKVFAFIDDTFTIDARRVKAISEVMREQHAGPWFCEGRIGVLYRHPEIIEMLGEAGLTRFQLGLESGSQKVLDAYRKDTRPEEIREVFRRCHAAGITSVIGNFIVGGAFEDSETFRESLQMAQDLIALGPGSTELLTCYLFPYTGTAIQEDPAQFDVEFLDDLDIYNAGSRLMCVNRTRALSRGEISQYKMALQSTILAAMLDQIDSLPATRIEKHILDARDYQISSEWYEVFLLCKPLALFVRYLLEFEGKTWGEIAARQDWQDFCPTRVGGLGGVRAENGHLVVPTRRNKQAVVSGFDRRVFELASGKLSLGEMIPLLQGRNGSDQPGPGELGSRLRASLERLAEDFLVVFKEL